jgi:hypothetical protein
MSQDQFFFLAPASRMDTAIVAKGPGPLPVRWHATPTPYDVRAERGDIKFIVTPDDCWRIFHTKRRLPETPHGRIFA